jgi:hypothetical protein
MARTTSSASLTTSSATSYTGNIPVTLVVVLVHLVFRRSGEIDPEEVIAYADDISLGDVKVFLRSFTHFLGGENSIAMADIFAVEEGSVKATQIAKRNEGRMNVEQTVMPRYVGGVQLDIAIAGASENVTSSIRQNKFLVSQVSLDGPKNYLFEHGRFSSEKVWGKASVVWSINSQLECRRRNSLETMAAGALSS